MKSVTEADIAAISVAPRVAEKDLEANIVHTTFFTAAEGSIGKRGAKSAYESLNLLTICVLVLKNGFTVTGESACASPENYDKEIGERLALSDAKKKIWPLMGYELRTRLGKEA